jgi:hypothetical protein
MATLEFHSEWIKFYLILGGKMKILNIVGLVAVAVLASAPARALTVVDFSGTTEGCFGTNCTLAPSATLDSHLSFTGGTFTSIPAGTVNVGFGSFSLGNGTETYDSTFTLDIAFTAPAGSGSNTFDADVTGSVHGHDGSVTINFDNTAETFNYSGGSFTVSVNDLRIDLGDPNITGTITLTAAVPEASTWAMMLLGFMGVGFIAYRRKNSGPTLRLA